MYYQAANVITAIEMLVIVPLIGTHHIHFFLKTVLEAYRCAVVMINNEDYLEP